jgi:glycosyltransferase involved in cell wall biosynthesis
MRIAIFDYYVERTNPIGECHRKLVEGVCNEHDVTVFAVRFDNPVPGRIKWVRVPVPTRPLALLFIAYHVIAPLCFAIHQLRHGKRFDLVQEVESNLSFGDLSYSHFCHRAFLRTANSPKAYTDLRSFLRWLDHRLHALVEPLIYNRVRTVVVPSQGLARELASEYPSIRERVIVISNPVDADWMCPPSLADRRVARERHGWSDEDIVFVFVALGHFERKGLPLLFEALGEVDDERVQLLVVGGQPDLVAHYRKRAGALGIGDRVRFVGMQTDVRPFLHTSDVFVLPSAYETFSLVALEAAAAGVPLLVTALHGVEEYVREGQNGFVVERNADAVAAGIAKFVALSPADRAAFGLTARRDASRYRLDTFVDAWREVYKGLTQQDVVAPRGSDDDRDHGPATTDQAAARSRNHRGWTT